MTPVETLLEKLVKVTRSGKGWSACCPAHDDRSPSLSISTGDDGKALVHCHAGCRFEDIVAAVGLTPRDLMPPSDDFIPTGVTPQVVWNGDSSGKPFARKAHAARDEKPKSYDTPQKALADLEGGLGKHSKVWMYHNAQGEFVGFVARWDKSHGKKVIRPGAKHPEGWRNTAMPVLRPLYGLPALADATRVVVTEGEKAADAARSLGFTATTSAGGSQAASQTDWEPLSGKEVWILPDNDEPGRKYADTVSSILSKLLLTPTVKVVELPGLADKGDIVEWIAAGGPQTS